MSEAMEFFGGVIDRYTRAQALKDGVLIDVSAVAKEMGIRFPTALTTAAWAKCVEVHENLKGEEDEEGHLWDILWKARLAMRGCEGDTAHFSACFRNPHRSDRMLRKFNLKVVCGPGDDLEPVLTIMLENEDQAMTAEKRKRPVLTLDEWRAIR